MEATIPPSKSSFLLCPFGGCGGIATTAYHVEGQDHAVMAMCPVNLQHYWFFCLKCDGTSVWKTRRSLNKHTKTFHLGEATNSTSHALPMLQAGEPKYVGFDSVNCKGTNRQFFEMDHMGRGCHFLVAMAFHNNTAASSAIDDFDVKVQMKLASLVSKLSRAENEELSSLLADVVDHTVAAKKRALSTWKTDIPVRYPEMRSRIIEGPRSILKNLPRPVVQMVDENHAYVSVIDCLADLLGHGYGVDVITGKHVATKWVSKTTRYGSLEQFGK